MCAATLTQVLHALPLSCMLPFSGSAHVLHATTQLRTTTQPLYMGSRGEGWETCLGRARTDGGRGISSDREPLRSLRPAVPSGSLARFEPTSLPE
mmetsp:Transcript_15716/g.42669  ORF Transcript_15716/g.42669 Transcript_15716/m.42669 type:complete len:95 (+) Transcript_15716:299-583(+)